MDQPKKARILEALMGLMRPVAQFLLRTGINYRDFSEIAKKAFVDTATETYGLRGRPTNVSRVALITGLTRKEVRHIQATSGGPALLADDNRSLPAEVLHRWHTAVPYVDPRTGKPLDLPFAQGDPSFHRLVRECMRDIPPGAVRTELKRMSAIEELESGELRVLKREMVPVDAEAKLAEGLETGLNPLARTILHNADPDNASDLRFQRIVSIPFVGFSDFSAIEKSLRERLISFTEELDDYLARFEVDERTKDKNPGLGVGIYYFRERE